MKILMTGVAGFIGSHAVEHFLSKGHDVYGIDYLTYASCTDYLADIKNFKFSVLDICDYQKISKLANEIKPDWIVNFAAETHVDNSIKNSSPFIHSNIVGTKILLDVCKENNIKMLHVSTDEVYGPANGILKSESDKLNPQNPYAASKASAEFFINSYINTYGVHTVMVRPANNFGPRQHQEKFIPTIMNSIKTNKQIPVYGDGKQIRDWLFVKDNVRAIEYIMNNSNSGQVFNISSNMMLENIELIKIILKKLNLPEQLYIEYVADRPGHDRDYMTSNKLLLSTGFKFDGNFEHQLEETIKYYLG